MEENRCLAASIRKDLDAKRMLVETCQILKKQIELTIQFHLERGAIVDVIYWDSKRGKAWMPNAHPLSSPDLREHT